jgi:opacity protein-like surface antigen
MRSPSIVCWAAAALAATSVRAHAQGAGVGSGHAFHALVLSTGMSTMSVDALNARVTPTQFAPLSNDAVSLGASGYIAVGRALLGAEVARSSFGEEGLDNGRTDELSVLHGLVTAGYALVATEHLSIYPQLGVGLGRVAVALRDRAGTSTTQAQPTFDEVAQAPGAESRLTGRHLAYSLGAGADYLVTRAGASRGVVLGVRAGLLASPNRTTWTRDGETVVAGPDAALGGPFLRVVVGFGGR